MNLQEIKSAVEEGKIVHWCNPLYTVLKVAPNEYQIKCTNGHCIGLVWGDGVTMNGKEKDFYIEERKATGYEVMIMDATKCTVEEAPKLEEIMRNDIFHSTLDWLTKAQFNKGARQAKEVYDYMQTDKYKEDVRAYLKENGIQDDAHFLAEFGLNPQ